MAFDKKPSTWFSGMTVNAASHTVTFTTSTATGNKTFPELTNGEADPTNGDYRKLVYAIMAQIYDKYQATPIADRPKYLTVFRGANVDANNDVDFTFSVTIKVKASGLEVPDEPPATP